MTTDPADLSAVDLLEHYAAGSLSSVDALDATLRRIKAHEPVVNAFVLTDPGRARAEAEASAARWQSGQPRGPLDGVPTTIKDLLPVIGWPTRRGSLATADLGPEQVDAPAVARLKEAGAVLVGKTTTPEFGWKAVTDSPYSGVTRNPWNSEKTTGGSSGGAVAAAALGMGAINIGTDGGGSIRIPASFTGVFGIKATYGRVPMWPTTPLTPLAHIGPLTRTVADAALALDVISRPDARDGLRLDPHADSFLDGLEGGVPGLRIAYSPGLGIAEDAVDAEVRTCVDEAVQVLAAAGATVERADPDITPPMETFNRHWFVGFASLLKRFGDDVRANMDPAMVAAAEDGAATSILDFAAHVEARTALIHAFSEFHADWDLLLTPAMPITAFEADALVPADSGHPCWPDWTPFSHPFNLTGQPAASVPCGFTSEGLPVGLQIVGPRGADALVLRAARAFERERPFVMPPRMG